MGLYFIFVWEFVFHLGNLWCSSVVSGRAVFGFSPYLILGFRYLLHSCIRCWVIFNLFYISCEKNFPMYKIFEGRSIFTSKWRKIIFGWNELSIVKVNVSRLKMNQDSVWILTPRWFLWVYISRGILKSTHIILSRILWNVLSIFPNIILYFINFYKILYYQFLYLLFAQLIGWNIEYRNQKFLQDFWTCQAYVEIYVKYMMYHLRICRYM